jgi:hypothetical protein
MVLHPSLSLSLHYVMDDYDYGDDDGVTITNDDTTALQQNRPCRLTIDTPITYSSALTTQLSLLQPTTTIITKQEPRRRRRVQFFESTKVVQFTESWKDYTQEEWEATWYSKYENSRRKRQLLSPSNTNDCRRGLESRIDRLVSQKRRNAKLCGWKVVLDEQIRQRKLGCFQPEQIASSYSKSISQTSSLEAHRQGLFDELETWDFDVNYD